MNNDFDGEWALVWMMLMAVVLICAVVGLKIFGVMP